MLTKPPISGMHRKLLFAQILLMPSCSHTFERFFIFFKFSTRFECSISHLALSAANISGTDREGDIQSQLRWCIGNAMTGVYIHKYNGNRFAFLICHMCKQIYVNNIFFMHLFTIHSASEGVSILPNVVNVVHTHHKCLHVHKSVYTWSGTLYTLSWHLSICQEWNCFFFSFRRNERIDWQIEAENSLGAKYT